MESHKNFRMKASVYIHIPFCEQHCYYCAFTVAVTAESAYEPYVRRLIQEIRSSGLSETGTIYFGGGTPSIIPPSLLGEVLGVIPKSDEEVSIEVNPGTVGWEKLVQYRDLGIQRISLGVQSLEDEDLERAGRLHRSDSVFRDYDMIRRAGFNNVNLDLIAGLPNQRLQTWILNLEGVVRLRPEHVSIYLLDQEERSAWGRHLPARTSDDDFAIFYQEAAERLSSAGYRQYEISNWALPGKECRHNLGYWTGLHYRGFGVGAHSYDGTERFWNTASLSEYARLIDENQSPVSGRETLTLQMKIEETFMLGLRLSHGFDVLAASRTFGFALPSEWFLKVDQFQHEGLVEFDGSILKLTPQGRLLASSVTEELLWPGPLSTFAATP